jgi:glycosyltransferase involved in cell wall biosynthesis
VKTSVIVANHGRDLTTLKASLPENVEFIEIDRGFERSKQRNMGIKEATGDIIIWLDSDQSISPGLVKECEELIENGYTAIFIPEIIIAESFFGKIRAFEREFLTGTYVDVPRAIKKAKFPYFDESMSGPEDADMGQRIEGKKTTSRNVLYHHDDISFKNYVAKKAYYTQSMRRYAEKWPNDPCINFKYRCWTVFTENGKWKKLLLNPILTLGVIFLLGVRAYVYFTNR